ncbi:MAG: DUF835 domain-containing protein [Thermoplasmata archaeon]
MNPFAFLSLASLVINVVLAGYILSKNPRGTTARIYVLLLAAFMLWDIPEFLVRALPSGDPQHLLLLIRLEWTGISFIPGVMAHFVLVYPHLSSLLERPWSFLVIYTPSIIFTSFLWAGDLLVRDVVMGPLGYSALVGPLYLPLGSLYALIIILAFAHLARAYMSPQDHRSKMRSGLLLTGFAIPTLAGTVTEVYGPYLFETGTRMGFGTAYTTVFLAFVAYAVFRYGFLVIEPAVEVGAVGRRYGWERGRNYLVLEKGRRNSVAAFRELVQDGPGLCVTAFPPQTLSEEFSLHRTPFLWLSSQEGYQWSLKPTYLEVDILQTILKFMRDNRRSVLLLDDLEYLAEINGFKPVLRTVSRIAAEASKYGCTLIVNLNPSYMGLRHLATLKGIFDEIPVTDEDEMMPRPSFVPPASILWEERREECFREISRATLKRKTLISTLFPGKLQSTYDLYDAFFLWITSTRHPKFPSYDASRLALEVLRDISRGVAKDTLIYLGELELLVEEAGFLTVLEYVKHIVDITALRSALVVASISRDAIPQGQLHILEKRFASIVG